MLTLEEDQLQQRSPQQECWTHHQRHLQCHHQNLPSDPGYQHTSWVWGPGPGLATRTSVSTVSGRVSWPPGTSPPWTPSSTSQSQCSRRVKTTSESSTFLETVTKHPSASLTSHCNPWCSKCSKCCINRMNNSFLSCLLSGLVTVDPGPVFANIIHLEWIVQWHFKLPKLVYFAGWNIRNNLLHLKIDKVSQLLGYLIIKDINLINIYLTILCLSLPIVLFLHYCCNRNTKLLHQKVTCVHILNNDIYSSIIQFIETIQLQDKVTNEGVSLDSLWFVIQRFLQTSQSIFRVEVVDWSFMFRINSLSVCSSVWEL